MSPVSKRFWLCFVLSGIVPNCIAQTLPCAKILWKQAPPNAVVNISINKPTFHNGEWPWITYRITNCGSFPFYIPKAIGDVEWHGGFEDVVTGPPNAKGVHSVSAGDYGPDYHLDIVKDVKDSWILLLPGEFYGGTERLNTAPATLGRWKVIGRHNPPRITGALREKLATDLKFPVLLEAVDSPPVYFDVVK